MLLRVSVLVLVVYGGLLALTYSGFQRTPKGFIPVAGQGLSAGQLAVARLGFAWSGRKQVMRRLDEIALKTPGVKHTVAIAGQSILLSANAPNFGAMYVMLDDFHHRLDPGAERATRSPRSCKRKFSTRSPKGLVNVLRRSAARRTGNRRRLQDHGRGPRRTPGSTPCRTTADKVVAEPCQRIQA